MRADLRREGENEGFLECLRESVCVGETNEIAKSEKEAPPLTPLSLPL